VTETAAVHHDWAGSCKVCFNLKSFFLSHQIFNISWNLSKQRLPVGVKLSGIFLSSSILSLCFLLRYFARLSEIDKTFCQNSPWRYSSPTCLFGRYDRIAL